MCAGPLVNPAAQRTGNDRHPKIEFYYDPAHDTNDGRPWSDMDIEDLVHELRHGGTIDSAARLLCRWGSKGDVRRRL
jgi:hypothetical protein